MSEVVEREYYEGLLSELQKERDWLLSTIIALDVLARGETPLSRENLIEITAVTLKRIKPAK